jgi:large subunit ribosomal protein L24
MSKLNIKKGDTVMVISGKSKGKTGKVLEVSPKEGKVIVEKANIVTKHVKPRRQGETGGRIEAEGPLYACKVQVICPKCKEAVRVGHKTLEDGSKGRVCKACGETF